MLAASDAGFVELRKTFPEVAFDSCDPIRQNIKSTIF
jgi:hypothetical protein